MNEGVGGALEFRRSGTGCVGHSTVNLNSKLAGFLLYTQGRLASMVYAKCDPYTVAILVPTFTRSKNAFVDCLSLTFSNEAERDPSPLSWGRVWSGCKELAGCILRMSRFPSLFYSI
eukprot:scaffold6807_cov220-Amphora_coffeaeformis.AAC.18